jgi:glycosyltransferase involved in cell wall biosynthesis
MPSGSSAGTRGYYLLKEIAALGHNCVIVASDSNLLAKSPQFKGRTFDQQLEGVHVRWIRTIKYLKASSLMRILSWLDFEVEFFLFGSKGLPRPDAIIVSSLSLLTILNGFLLRRKYKCKLIFEVRDIWPLTLIVEGNYSRLNPFVKILGWIEYFGYKYSDEIVGTMPNLQQRVEEVLGYTRHVHCIPMGFDADDYNHLIQQKIVDNDFIKPSGKFVIGYIGSMGVSNALDQLFWVAERTLNETSIQYVITGTGDLELTFRKRYQHLTNVTFQPKIPKWQVPGMLEQCDVLFFATHPSVVWEYGQSLNKLVDYMLSGKPIIGSYTGFESMINEAKCGVFVQSGDITGLVKKIVYFSRHEKSELQEMGDRGRKWIHQHRTYRILGLRYLNAVLLK